MTKKDSFLFYLEEKQGEKRRRSTIEKNNNNHSMEHNNNIKIYKVYCLAKEELEKLRREKYDSRTIDNSSANDTTLWR